jgi:hypothetical protein
MRRSESELRQSPLQVLLEPGEIVKLVMDVLVKEVHVDVPDPSTEPDGNLTLEELSVIWRKERRALAALI